MNMQVPHIQPELASFLRNPANDMGCSKNEDLPPLPRSVTDNFQNWAAGQIAGMAKELKRLGKLMISQGKTIHEQMETIEDLRFKLAEANARADTDGLTGLFNKAYFTRELDAIYQDNTPKNEPRKRTGDTILMIDLDGFKPINDIFGHAAGDRALCEVANLLTTCVRDTDTVARMGGDEFAIILRGADVKQSNSKVKEIDQKLNSLSFVYNESVICVGGSVGNTRIDWGKPPSQNLDIADKNMISIKRSKKQTHGDMRSKLIQRDMQPTQNVA